MRNSILGLFVLGLLLTSCGNKKIIEARPEHSIHIHNMTMQEMVPGVQGQGSTFQFLMNVEMNSSVISVDSLYFNEMKGKVFVKDADKNLYTAKLRAPLSPSEMKINTKETVLVSFLNEGEKIVMQADSLTVLNKMYLP